MTDQAIDMAQITEIADSVCGQLAAYGERADADWLTLASACGLAAGMFLAGNLEPDSLTFDLVRELVDEVVTVSEEAILWAMRDLAGVDHVVSEGAGAVAVAALLTDAVRTDGRPVVAIVSGANVDRETLAAALRS